MKFSEEVIEHPDYLHIRYHGRWDPKSSVQGLQEIARRLTQGNHRKVLVDDRELILETSINIDFRHAIDAVEILKGKCDKIAMIDHPENDRFNLFFETVCVNRGLNLKYFHDEVEAVNWLMQ